jgi:thiol-disulfide isomerase/thioredoxin
MSELKEPEAPNYSAERWEQATHISNALPNGSVYVAWTAPWCGPCKAMKPTLERVAAELDKQLFIVNVDEIKGMAVAFNIRSVPTVMELRDGFPTNRRLIGGHGEAAIREYLNA